MSMSAHMHRQLSASEDVRRFLNLEADVDDEVSSGDSDSDESLDDFLTDEEPIPTDRSHSHNLLVQQYSHIQKDDEWASLLARAQARGRRLAAHESHHSDGVVPLSDVQLWRVAVKPGWEETAAFVLMQKVVRGVERHWNVASIVGRVSRPGWIIVEAPSVADVYAVCQGFSNIYWDQTFAVEPQEGPVWLKEADFYLPSSQSWVRLTRYPYKNDIAYVRDFSSRGANVLVVPRINFQRRSSISRGKQKSDSNHLKRVGRPAQALFDVDKVTDVWGTDSVIKQSSTTFIFKKKTYLDGYLCLVTDDFKHQEATPTIDEIMMFHCSQVIPQGFIKHAVELASTQRLQISDSVKVIEGAALGATGIVTDITGNEATLCIYPDTQLTLSTTSLRKNVVVGDEVIIIVGPHSGVTGWVVAVTEEVLVVHDPKSLEHIVITSHGVNFYDAPVIMGPSSDQPTTASAGADTFFNSHTKIKLGEDRNRQLIGKHVHITGKSAFKGYKGLVKSTQQDNHLLVELNATMRQESFHLTSIALWDDPHQTPLFTVNLTSPRFDTAPTIEEVAATSSVAPSTPLPPEFRDALCPAWDLSLHTLNPCAIPSFTCNPWMDSPLLSSKKIKVQIRGTKRAPPDPGWKCGDHEGKRGLWVGIEGDMSKITLGRTAPMLVPEKYVHLIRPSVRGENVVVIDGDLKGTEYRVVGIGPIHCKLRNRDKRDKSKDETTLDLDILAVVV